MKEKIEVNVRLALDGEDAVRAIGLVVEQTVRSIKVKTTPTHIPETFHADISKLRAGKTMHVSEIPLPEGVELANAHDGEAPIVHIFAPRGTTISEEANAS